MNVSDMRIKEIRSEPIEDILETVLNGYQLRVEIVSETIYCGSWYDDERQTQRGQFHLIGAGECEVTGPMLSHPHLLRGGDLAIFPHGTRHRLAAAPGNANTADSYTSMLCGELEFINGSRNPVLNALPECLIVNAHDGGESFRKLSEVLGQFARDPRLGQRIVMNKLADSLFTLAVCEYAHGASDPRGIFAALADRHLARALDAIHRRPGESWTLDGLAQLAGMSRSAFAQHFTEVMQMPPIAYLTAWRVTQAKQLLRERRLSVAAIAERMGYKSEAAFRKLFKRIEGVGPGKIRSEARSGESSEHPPVER